MNDIKIGTKVAMVLTDMPLGIQVGKRHLLLYPQTLGRMYLTAQLIEGLCVNQENMRIDPFMEAIRIVREHKEECCKLIAYYTLLKKSEMLNSRIVKARENVFLKSCDDEDIATILISILSDNKLNEIIKETHIDKEEERMRKINSAKSCENQYVFGGKSIWGSIVDVACERYGWTLDYVVWEISYNNLTLMLKDKITSIYLSDEERKNAHIPSANERVFDGNNKEDIMALVRESEENPS